METQGYILLTPDRVEAFLLAHPDLVDFLQRLPVHIAPWFPFPETKLSLRVQDDVEVEGKTYLFIGVHTPLSPGEAYLRIGEFDEAWWLDHEPDEVAIDVEFTSVEEIVRDATRL